MVVDELARRRLKTAVTDGKIAVVRDMIEVDCQVLFA